MRKCTGEAAESSGCGGVETEAIRLSYGYIVSSETAAPVVGPPFSFARGVLRCMTGLDGRNLNQELVKQGWCWWYRKYAPGDTVLEGLEKDAREARRGLWADPQPVPPWEWRKGRW